MKKDTSNCGGKGEIIIEPWNEEICNNKHCECYSEKSETGCIHSRFRIDL